MRLIDVDELAKHEHWASVVKALSCAPEVHAVAHGRWIMQGGSFRCSVCDSKAKFDWEYGHGGWSKEYEQAKTPYCPNCGAKMDL